MAQPSSSPPAPSINALRLMGWGLLLTYALMVVIHLLDAGRPGAMVGLISSGATIVVILAAELMVSWKPPSPRGAHHLTGLFALLVLVNIALHYVAARDPTVTAMFVFYLLGIGGLILHRGWLATLLMAGYGTWLVATLAFVPHENATRDGLAMGAIAVVAGVLHVVRVRSIRREEGLRLEAERREVLAETRLAALERSQVSLTELVERNPDGIVIHHDGVVLYASRRFADMLRHDDATELMGLPLTQLIDVDDPLDVTATGIVRELRVRRGDGEIARLEVVSADIHWQQRRATLLSARDVTMRHDELARRLLESDRLLTVGRLAAGVAHEINNPLQSLITGLDEMARQPLGEEGRALVGESRAAALRVRAIVAQLSTFIRPSAPRAERIDVVELVESSLRLAEHSLAHVSTIDRSYSAHPQVAGDAHQLGQVIINLVVNAAQAMVDTPSAARKRLTLIVGEDDKHAVIAVGDTGTGMTPQVRRRIFEPFFTTKPVGHGTGLGLHYCHNAVASLGGALRVATELGVGTTFTMRLPLLDESVALEKNESAAPELAELRVVVLDDDPGVARSVARMLRGHHAFVAASPAEAIDLMASGDYDALLCDVMMPNTDGIEVRRRLEVTGHEKAIVFMTGGAFGPAAQEFIDRVDNPVLQKPFELDELEAALAFVTREARGVAVANRPHHIDCAPPE